MRVPNAAAARAIKFEAVIAAGDAVALDLAEAQRGEAMRAGVIQRERLPAFTPIENDGLFVDGARDRRIGQLVTPARRVPGVAQIRHPGLLFRRDSATHPAAKANCNPGCD